MMTAEKRLEQLELVVAQLLKRENRSYGHYDAVELMLANLGINNYRLRNGLVERGVWFPSDINRLSDSQLKQIRGVGKGTIVKLREATDTPAFTAAVNKTSQ